MKKVAAIGILLSMGGALAEPPKLVDRSFHRDRGIFVGPAFSFSWLDSDRGLDDNNPGATGLFAAYNVTKHWSVVGSSHRSRESSSSQPNQDGRIRFNSLGLTYNIVPDARIAPYVGVQAGRIEFENDNQDDSSTLTFDAGAYIFIRRSIALRLNYGHWIGYSDSTDDKLASIAIVAQLGGNPELLPQDDADSDGDGVTDGGDRCPGTPAGSVVDEFGCALETIAPPPTPEPPPPPADTDGDQVADDNDYCPGSPAGVAVDQYGCEMLSGLSQQATLYGVAYPKSGLADAGTQSQLDGIAAKIKAKAYSSVELEAHTDSRAKAGISRARAQKRAEVVAQALVDRGVDGGRVVALGFGETQPIADNATSDGRALNNRVLITAWNTVEKQQRRCAEKALPEGASQDGCKVLKPVQDADADGIADANDLCPGTTTNAKVDVRGCVLGEQIAGTDADGDGIADGVDYCPNSAKGAEVDLLGCSTEDGKVERLLLQDVTFNTNSTNLNESAAGVLDRAVNRLKGRSFKRVIIEGHTDSTDTDGYNAWLSLRRSRAVRNYLALEGIPTQNLSIVGFGEGQPIADNKTPEGRARNRRVIISIR